MTLEQGRSTRTRRGRNNSASRHSPLPHLCRCSGEDPPAFRQFQKGASAPFLCLPLPSVPVVSPPTSRGAHGRARAYRRVSVVLKGPGGLKPATGAPRSGTVPGAFPGAVLEGGDRAGRFWWRRRRGAPVPLRKSRRGYSFCTAAYKRTPNPQRLAGVGGAAWDVGSSS